MVRRCFPVAKIVGSSPIGFGVLMFKISILLQVLLIYWVYELVRLEYHFCG